MPKRKARPPSSRRDIIEASIGAVLVTGLFVAIAIAIYQRSTSTGSFRDEYKGTIIDKRISVVETNEGSRFAKELIVEEVGRHRFTVSVTQEIYDRAKPGMLIQRTAANGIQLFPKPEHNYSGE